MKKCFFVFFDALLFLPVIVRYLTKRGFCQGDIQVLPLVDRVGRFAKCSQKKQPPRIVKNGPKRDRREITKGFIHGNAFCATTEHLGPNAAIIPQTSNPLRDRTRGEPKFFGRFPKKWLTEKPCHWIIDTTSCIYNTGGGTSDQ